MEIMTDGVEAEYYSPLIWLLDISHCGASAALNWQKLLNQTNQYKYNHEYHTHNSYFTKWLMINVKLIILGYNINRQFELDKR